jgi:uncharacterized protein (UPF0218 family)
VSDVLLQLPDALRGELKDPLGPIYTDTERLLANATEPIIAVGDIVTYHFLEAGYTPAVALVDQRTKRAAVDNDVKKAVVGDNGPPAFDERITVSNPAATLTAELLSALRKGIAGDDTTLIVVDGEEDLAALPAILTVPEGASVVYGQPDEGMVLVTADAGAREHVSALLERMDGDQAAVFDRVESKSL